MRRQTGPQTILVDVDHPTYSKVAMNRDIQTIHTDVDPHLVRRLADLNGVATNFWTWGGELKDVTSINLLRILHALGVPVTASSDNQQVIEAIVKTEDTPWLKTLPDCTVVRKGDWRDLLIHVEHGQSINAWYTLEDGSSGPLYQLDRYVPPREVEGQWRGRATFEIPGTLPLGYHRIFVEINGGDPVSAPLIVVPHRINPTVLHGDKRFWGVNAQIYSVQSSASWGVGDAADLADLLAITAREDASFLLLNPVHACEPISPVENSPYRPVSRQWLNVTYIRPEDILEYATLSEYKRKKIKSLRNKALAAADNEGGLLDRDSCWEAKRTALHDIFTAPRAISREGLFQAFCLEGGESLQKHALWSALVEEHGSTDLPPEYASSVSPASLAFADNHPRKIEFHKWLQWIAAEQLTGCNRIAHELGMSIGVMADLAVGIHPSGSEVWSHPELFAKDAYVGAPPDMYSQQGQCWTQPPFNPQKLAEVGYEPLRGVIRTALSLAGALRIDHILGFFRLWWLPVDGSPAEGTYVYYDHEATIGILLLEAARADAVLIGEDLGTVEPWVREYLASRGILGTSVLWFEKEDSGWPLHAEHYRRDILAAVNTHDLPPTKGYMEGVQTTLRDELGLLVEPVEQVRAQDAAEQEQMLTRVREYALVEEDADEEQVLGGLHRYVSRTPARLVTAALVDAVGEKRPQNLPGTDQEYPNWRVPLADGSGTRVLLDNLANAEGIPLFKTMRDEFSH